MNGFTEPVAPVALGFILTLLAAPVVLALLRRAQLVDTPNERSSHAAPTPRGGGLAPAAGGLVALAVASAVGGAVRAPLFVVAGGLAGVGLIDDLRGLQPFVRLACQLAIAAVALAWLLQDLRGPAGWQVLFGAGCLIWLVAFVNGFNFMDGINGISVAQVVVAGAAWWAVARSQDLVAVERPAAIVAAVALGFLPFNFPKARMFLGDIGSYFFGGWLAVLVVVGLRAGLPAEAMVFPLALYLADTATTIARRARRGEAWYLAHRDHTYQRLVQTGWSHTRTTLVVAGFMLTLAGLGAVSLSSSLAFRLVADAAAVVVLVSYLGLPSLLQTAGPPAGRAVAAELRTQ